MSEKNNGLLVGKILARRAPANLPAEPLSGGVPVGAAAKKNSKDAQSHLVKEGEIVKRIEVTCGCGKTISLICE